MRTQTKKLTVIAVLCAIAYVVMVFGRIPVVMFLKYDPKDVVIAIGGFLYGPLTSAVMSVIVSFVEMFTVSDTGIIGVIMNVISTCAFACTAAFIYKRQRNTKGMVIGLIAGWLIATAMMMLWNYLITPFYMDLPREKVVGYLIPAILPFNLLKYGLNAAITILLHRSLSVALRKSNLMPNELPQETGARVFGLKVGSVLVSAFAVVTGVLIILVFQGKL